VCATELHAESMFRVGVSRAFRSSTGVICGVLLYRAGSDPFSAYAPGLVWAGDCHSQRLGRRVPRLSSTSLRLLISSFGQCGGYGEGNQNASTITSSPGDQK